MTIHFKTKNTTYKEPYLYEDCLEDEYLDIPLDFYEVKTSISKTKNSLSNEKLDISFADRQILQEILTHLNKDDNLRKFCTLTGLFNKKVGRNSTRYLLGGAFYIMESFYDSKIPYTKRLELASCLNFSIDDGQDYERQISRIKKAFRDHTILDTDSSERITLNRVTDALRKSKISFKNLELKNNVNNHLYENIKGQFENINDAKLEEIAQNIINKNKKK
ncbi:hypothetical protein [Photobacterium leiognathi]|uniref:hypothetical protein n=1 Tax=Photobacterium leiognathi TaxID=553611 RepID=UPI002982AD95|nr:hypothetical protein [Photobacterium leiognathi]